MEQKRNLLLFLLLVELFFSSNVMRAENILFHQGKFANEWTFNLINLSSVMRSLLYLEGDSALCLESGGDPVKMGYEVLSRHRAIHSKILISIRYKTYQCRKINLIITRKNDCRTSLKADTIKLKPSVGWISVKRYIKVHEPQLLNVSIEVERMNGCWGKLWLSDISIPRETLTPADSTLIDYTFASLRSDIKCWSGSHWNQFPFMQKTILGIGETSHGTQEMGDIAISIMKERIQKNNC